MTLLSRIRVTTAALAIALSACGGSAAAPSLTAAPAAAAAAAVSLDIQGFTFPANTDVAKGTKVTWTNKDAVGHTVTSGTPPTKDGKFDGPVAAAGSFSVTFSEAGIFKYFCSIHNSMTGTITVK